jgi:ABC-type multidrug transport system fused ATPase/permease subunit
LIFQNPDWFVSYWSQTSTSGIYSNHFYIGIYAALLGAYIISIVAKALLFALFALRASTNLHNGVFSSVLRAPMSFFDSTPLGRILNRFTKDQDNIDDMLPDVLDQAVGSLLIVLSSVGLIIAVLYWFAIAIVPLVAIFYFIGVRFKTIPFELHLGK